MKKRKKKSSSTYTHAQIHASSTRCHALRRRRSIAKEKKNLQFVPISSEQDFPCVSIVVNCLLVAPAEAPPPWKRFLYERTPVCLRREHSLRSRELSSRRYLAHRTSGPVAEFPLSLADLSRQFFAPWPAMLWRSLRLV